MLADFYRTLSSLGFTLLGLWWIVIQLRYRDGQGDFADRRHAYGVLLFFLAPATMGLLAVVDPTSAAMWRTVFTIIAALGLIEIVLYLASHESHSTAALALRGAGLVDYVCIMAVALAPRFVSGTLKLRPLSVEAVLLTALVIIGIHMVFLAIVERPPPQSTLDPASDPNGDPEG